MLLSLMSSVVHVGQIVPSAQLYKHYIVTLRDIVTAVVSKVLHVGIFGINVLF